MAAAIPRRGDWPGRQEAESERERATAAAAASQPVPILACVVHPLYLVPKTHRRFKSAVHDALFRFPRIAARASARAAPAQVSQFIARSQESQFRSFVNMPNGHSVQWNIIDLWPAMIFERGRRRWDRWTACDQRRIVLIALTGPIRVDAVRAGSVVLPVASSARAVDGCVCRYDRPVRAPVWSALIVARGERQHRY